MLNILALLIFVLPLNCFAKSSFKDIEKLDPFFRRYEDPKSLKKEKIKYSTEVFYLRKGTIVFSEGNQKVLRRRMRVRALYSPYSTKAMVIDKKGRTIFEVSSKSLIAADNVERIVDGYEFKKESEKHLEQIKQEPTRVIARLGYGGSLFEDSFNPQFLSPQDEKIYAGCVEIQTEMFLVSFQRLMTGIGLYLTTGQYLTIDNGPVFQNLSFGPSVKFPVFQNIFIGLGATYTISHDITVDSNSNLQNTLSEKFISLELLSQKNLTNWAFGLKLRSIKQEIRFQENNNAFQTKNSSLSMAAYISKGFDLFSL